MKKKLTQERLKELLHYNYNTGLFIWIADRGIINIKGCIAGNLTNYGYIRIMVDGESHFAHRLAWLYMYGYFPENDIDHIDRSKINNSITNLREVTRQCNMRNVGMLSNNTSGVKGVSKYKKLNNWRARIMVNKKEIRLGYFKNIIDAVMARWDAEKKYNFPNCNTTSSAYEYLKKYNLINIHKQEDK